MWIATRAKGRLKRDIARLGPTLWKRQRGRRVLNHIYPHLPPAARAHLQEVWGRSLAGVTAEPGGIWRQKFAGVEVAVPFDHPHVSEAWDFALALTGHDVDVKAQYERLILAPQRPRVFFDVGANYGTHSLLFLAHGVTTVSFEPNPACHDFFQGVCAANGLSPNIEPVALGDHEGSVTLHFPPGETWLGTLSDDRARDLAVGHTMNTVDVRVTTIDAYTKQSGLSPDVIKIDTEGNELAVLLGGTETLKACRPTVIFEAWMGEHRRALYSVLDGLDFAISVPGGRRLSEMEFATTPAENFVATP